MSGDNDKTDRLVFCIIVTWALLLVMCIGLGAQFGWPWAAIVFPPLALATPFIFAAIDRP